MPCASTRDFLSPSRAFNWICRGNLLFRAGVLEPSENEAQLVAIGRLYWVRSEYNLKYKYL